MKDIENWIDERIKDYSEDSYNLFKESILCYNIKAYRASFLFSYLGFFKYIKELLNKSKKPTAIVQTRWDSIIRNIKIEEKWEEEILTALNNSSNPIFNISENIRTQIKYWKDRRNDSAHAKDNIINHHHVEIFWTFLRSNLSKITVEGGKLNLLNKFEDQFDTTKTSAFESYEYLINEIENSVEIADINDFIKELGVITISKTYDYSKVYELYEKILIKYNSVAYIKEAVINQLKTTSKDLDFLANHPSNFGNLKYSNSEIRQIWKTKIYTLNNSHIKDKIIGVLLSNLTLPSTDLKELIELYITNFDQSGFRNLTKEPHIRNLIANNHFLDKMYSVYFDQDKMKDMDYSIINKQADLIALYIEKVIINKDLIKTLSLTYHKSYPNFLTDSLKYIITANPNLKSQINSICVSEGITNLTFLN